MTEFLPTFDAILFAALTTCLVRETMLRTLPDHIAGPGGWLIDTTAD